MVGSAVLVAPILKKGTTRRSVYLPKGKWVPWNGGPAIDGGKTIEVDAPLGEIPVFARGGQVVPMFPETVRTVIHEAKGVVRDEDIGDDRNVLVIGGGERRFSEPSGPTYELSTGSGTDLSWNGAALAECGATPVAPCAKKSADRIEVWAVGPGKLVAGTAVIEVTRGKSDQKLHFDVR
jgi:hypothetical protein